MEGVKALLESKTVWGAVISIAASALAAGRHITISPADQSVLVNMLVDAVSAGGALYAIYGRSVAQKKIG